ncbi:hypothetical protein Y032_0187g1125 [Ancylostoma ceylanicum]|uniref:Uncharacterized protein n=1 Tax=Ancylostoma ceylanicum TaxID=53326 RepID=A0A016SQT0_9BILA|nr:hypothetical protein Y032_0187g1125 [Ancylostoma ceylanicum]
MRFRSVAVAESRWDLIDPLTWSMLFPHPSHKTSYDSAVTEFVYFLDKDCTSGGVAPETFIPFEPMKSFTCRGQEKGRARKLGWSSEGGSPVLHQCSQ